MEKIIEVNHLTKKFQNFLAINDISFSIKKNSFVSVLGPNGAGKTTLLEILEGIQNPTSGEVKIFNREWQKGRNFLKKRIGLCLQETNFIEKLKVKETFELFASFHNVSKKRIEEVISKVFLNEKKNELVKNLSGGQKQRLAIGLAILHKPEILFLDEPTVGLDPEIRQSIWSLLLDLRLEYSLTVILTTHYMEEAEKLSDYIFLINKGKIISEGTLGEIYQKFNKNIKVEFDLNTDQEGIKKIENYSNSRRYFSFKIERDEIKKNLYRFTHEITNQLDLIKIIDEWFLFFKKNKIDFSYVEIHKPNLNDIFLEITGTSLNSEGSL